MAGNRSRRTIAAALGAAALAGAGAGAGIYAAAGGTGTQTRTVTATAAAATPVAAASQLGVAEIYRRSAKGVVEITVTGSGGGGGGQSFPFGAPQQSRAQGSGFVYDTAGHVVTNEHVVAGASSIRVTFSDGSSYPATVVGQDASTDVAVLKVDAPAGELHPLAFGDSSAIAVGDGVVAIGAPFGLEDTVTSGIVSAVGREIQAPDGSTITDTIQTDAAINHGNSGGPLLDAHGKVIGITSQIESDSGGNDGVGFAVSSNTAARIVKALIANGKVEHAFLGVSIQTIPPSAARTLGEAAGAAVADVRSGSAADDAGLVGATGTRTVGGVDYPTGGDVITAVGGEKVAGADELRSAIGSHKPGDTLKLTVVRGGKTRTVTVTLGSRS